MITLFVSGPCPPLLRLLANAEVRPVWGNADEAALLDAYERVWRRKAILRDLYQSWYRRVEQALRPGPVVEVGAGTGNFKRWLAPRRCITVDILRGRWVDVQADALRLPVRDASVLNIVLIDALHHFAAPVAFLQEARRALAPGGRLLLVEPYVSWWGTFVYRYLHHERVDFTADLTRPTVGAWDGNAAIPRLVLAPAPLARAGLRLAHVEYFECLAYPLSGGFSYRAMLPGPLLSGLRLLERLPPFTSRLLALRAFAILERDDATARAT